MIVRVFVSVGMLVKMFVFGALTMRVAMHVRMRVHSWAGRVIEAFDRTLVAPPDSAQCLEKRVHHGAITRARVWMRFAVPKCNPPIHPFAGARGEFEHRQFRMHPRDPCRRRSVRDRARRRQGRRLPERPLDAGASRCARRALVEQPHHAGKRRRHLLGPSGDCRVQPIIGMLGAASRGRTPVRRGSSATSI